MNDMHSPADILGHAAHQFGDKTALITPHGVFSYRQLDSMSNSVAHALHE
jgi:acyl-CoA synthetase (AMP-forming)/AMP-acid ligase II